MKRLVLILACLALTACKEDLAAGRPVPVALTEESVGHYCQMELLDHPGPKGQVHLDGMEAPLFFSQVKDALAYLHAPEQSHAVRATYVQDMAGAATWEAPGAWIAVEDALYVIGSDRLGGMNAPEFVPFSNATDAEAFAARHGGEVRTFDGIGPGDVLAPAETAPAHGGDMAARLSALRGEAGSE